jgi:hypothetical protein
VPSSITAYRVFIASPGGLEDERKAFRRIINSHNEDAIERGVIFRPIGWEDIRGGVGRPQHLINRDVRRCDYFVLVLWDRWGSPPDVDEQGRFKSGSEEELGVARECYEAGTMRNIVVFFKDVSPDKVRDPGPQLQAVLDFRKCLERQKTFFYQNFDAVTAFEERLRGHLFGWVRDHEEGREAAPTPPSRPVMPVMPIETLTDVEQAPSSQAVQGAEQLVKQGRLAEAEETLARANPHANLDSLNQYGAVLVEKGSLEGAEKAFRQLHDLAVDQGHGEWVVASLNNLATVYRAQGKLDLAESSYKRVLELREAALGPDHPDVVASLNSLAELYTSLRRFDEAEPLLIRALEIQGVPVV